MRFIETSLPGAFVIEPDCFTDQRGFFTHTFTREEFARRGCVADILECNVSFNHKAGTMRGMHLQLPPHAQSKLVRCTRGAIWDCAIDLRPGSTTFKQWFGVELSAENHRQFYIPPGMAHGYLTLVDGAEVLYQVGGGAYNPGASRGVRWDDPAFGIQWPQPVTVIIERDARYPDFSGQLR